MPGPPSRRPSGRSSRPPDGWWPPASKPIPVKGGVTARSKRGQIGDTWWSQRFISVLESFGVGNRLQRGRRYARTGQVLSLEIVPGQVRASVQGSRSKPYRVFIETEVLTDSDWGRIEDVMASRAVFLAKLLAGEMPEEIEEAFVECSTTLFPAPGDDLDDDLVSACSCPDWENPCKHVAAVFYLMAEAFDRDPFLIFAWRGRDKEQLLAGLRQRRRGPGARVSESETEEAADEPENRDFGWPAFDPSAGIPTRASEAASFWGNHDDVSAIEVRPRLAVAADLVLRQLDPSPLGEDAGIVDEFRPLYERITSNAIAMAFGEEPTS
ncbi:MAG TPA: SWIM zinc finger family protein [Acidimicrobiales bacterium]|nr:SWIM zinc finger family protein [Acidimicrobiales bacterium]